MPRCALRIGPWRCPNDSTGVLVAEDTSEGSVDLCAQCRPLAEQFLARVQQPTRWTEHVEPNTQLDGRPVRDSA